MAVNSWSEYGAEPVDALFMPQLFPTASRP